jgi:hypothetical protein
MIERFDIQPHWLMKQLQEEPQPGCLLQSEVSYPYFPAPTKINNSSLFKPLSG